MSCRAFMVAFGLPVLFAVGPARAEHWAARYEAHWAGLPAGVIRLGMTEGDGSYEARLQIDTVGLPRWFTHFRASVSDSGGLSSTGPAQPAHYAAHFDLRKRHDRLISFTFSQDGDAVQAERDAADTSGKPQLPAEFRRDVLEPLSALVSIRQWLAQVPRQVDDAFRFKVYDGARRFDVDGTVEPDPDRDGLIHLQLTLRPIAGFKGESSQEGDPDSAPRPLRLALNRTTLVPVSMRVSIAFLPFTVHLERECSDFDRCASDDDPGHD